MLMWSQSDLHTAHNLARVYKHVLPFILLIPIPIQPQSSIIYPNHIMLLMSLLLQQNLPVLVQEYNK